MRKERREKGVLHYIGLGLSAGLLALVLLVGALVILIPIVSGSTPMTILTSSMEPTYPPGTLVIVKPTAPEDIRIGDPLTYQIESGKPDVVTHRVVAIATTDGKRTFTTKGDNNNAADPKPVVPEQVRGTVWYAVPYVGYANTIVNGPNRGWIVPLIAIALLAYAGYMFASGITQSIRKRRQGTSVVGAHSAKG